jgi:hypothetical protein
VRADPPRPATFASPPSSPSIPTARRRPSSESGRPVRVSSISNSSNSSTSNSNSSSISNSTNNSNSSSSSTNGRPRTTRPRSTTRTARGWRRSARPAATGPTRASSPPTTATRRPLNGRGTRPRVRPPTPRCAASASGAYPTRPVDIPSSRASSSIWPSAPYWSSTPSWAASSSSTSRVRASCPSRGSSRLRYRVKDTPWPGRTSAGSCRYVGCVCGRGRGTRGYGRGRFSFLAAAAAMDARTTFISYRLFQVQCLASFRCCFCASALQNPNISFNAALTSALNLSMHTAILKFTQIQ